jgi:hypothetical protein
MAYKLGSLRSSHTRPGVAAPAGLAAQLTAARAAGTGNAHTLACNVWAEQARIGWNGVAAEQFVDGDRPQGINAGAAAGDVDQRGHLQQGDAVVFQVCGDAAEANAAQRRDRQECPVSIRLMGDVNLVDRWNQAP